MKKIISILIVISIMGVSLISSLSLAWVSDNGMSSDIDVTGNVHQSYFSEGEGSELDPLQISYPVQLYYFAWLQYMGYFNVDEDGDGLLDTVYATLEDDLDMTGYVLPPIGTVENPFVGNFDGNGHTVSNVTVENIYGNMYDPPELGLEDADGIAEIIGFFGVVGEIGEIDLNYDTQANEVKNLILEDITVITQTGRALIGTVAGYVNGTIHNVGVIGSTVNVKGGTAVVAGFSNISDYSVIGYCTEEYADQFELVNSSAYAPNYYKNDNIIYSNTANGDGAGWGGSLDMVDLHTRIGDYYEMAQAREYISAETRTYAVGADTPTINRETAISTALVEYEPEDAADGHYIFSKFGDSGYNQNSTQYYFLFGGDRTPINVTTNRYSERNATCISYGNYYLSVNGTSVSSVTNSANASGWNFSNQVDYDGTITTVINGETYYLSNNNGVLELSMDKATVWDNIDGALTSTIGNAICVLVCVNGTWTLMQSTLISIGNNYLSANVNGIANQNAANATLWTVVNNSYVSTVIGGTTYYLNNNNGTLEIITAQNNATNWSYENGKLVSVYNNAKYALDYSDTDGWHLVIAGYYVSYYNSSTNTTYYLSLNANRNGVANNVTSEANASVWYFTGGTHTAPAGNMYTVIDGTRYYLNVEYSSFIGIIISANFTASNAASTSWIYENGRLITTASNGRNYNIRLNGTSWAVQTDTGNSTLTFTTYYPSAIITLSAQNFDVNYANYINTYTNTIVTDLATTVTQEDPYDVNATYLPLSASIKEGETDYTIDKGNTGYIVSGSSFLDTSHRATEVTPIQSGDIRISYYDFNYLSASYSGANSYSEANSSRLEVVTSTYKSNGFVRISDSYNQNNTEQNVSNDLKNAYGSTKTPVADLGLEKYNDSRDTLHEILLKNPSRIYGLHFMDAAISKDNLITIDRGYINGEEVTNYQLPRDSIDFNLKEKGYVNFFAGSYYNYTGNNTSFFSFHEIIRDESGKNIVEIKEISKIYGNPDSAKAPYIYQYAGESTPSLEAGYVLMFDTSWITAPDIIQNALYYFEIPVNAGEYALGSVPGEDGAYLIYLDLAANAQIIQRTKVVERTVTVESEVRAPKGVSILESDGSIDSTDENYHLNSAYVTLGANASGEIKLDRNGNVITLSGTHSGSSAFYIGDGITLQDSAGNPLSMVGERLKTTTVDRTLYIDYNTVTDQTLVIAVITTTVTDANGNVIAEESGTTMTGTFYTDYDMATGTGTQVGEVLVDETRLNAYIDSDTTGEDDIPIGEEEELFVALEWLSELPESAEVTVTYNFVPPAEGSTVGTYYVTITSDVAIDVLATLNTSSDIAVVINGTAVTGSATIAVEATPTAP